QRPLVRQQAEHDVERRGERHRERGIDAAALLRRRAGEVEADIAVPDAGGDLDPQVLRTEAVPVEEVTEGRLTRREALQQRAHGALRARASRRDPTGDLVHPMVLEELPETGRP